jgi:hypothetical protein
VLRSGPLAQELSAGQLPPKSIAMEPEPLLERQAA